MATCSPSSISSLSFRNPQWALQPFHHWLQGTPAIAFGLRPWYSATPVLSMEPRPRLMDTRSHPLQHGMLKKSPWNEIMMLSFKTLQVISNHSNIYYNFRLELETSGIGVVHHLLDLPAACIHDSLRNTSLCGHNCGPHTSLPQRTGLGFFGSPS